jgi:predicted GNAT family acetyltransferase
MNYAGFRHRRLACTPVYIADMSEAPSIPIETHVSEDGGRVEVTAEAGERVGVLVMSRIGPNRLIIEHVHTLPGFEGRGVGGGLVAAGVEWARANGQMLMPLCPFARQMFDRHPEYSDVRTGL